MLLLGPSLKRDECELAPRSARFHRDDPMVVLSAHEKLNIRREWLRAADRASIFEVHVAAAFCNVAVRFHALAVVINNSTGCVVALVLNGNDMQSEPGSPDCDVRPLCIVFITRELRSRIHGYARVTGVLTSTRHHSANRCGYADGDGSGFIVLAHDRTPKKRGNCAKRDCQGKRPRCQYVHKRQ